MSKTATQRPVPTIFNGPLGTKIRPEFHRLLINSPVMASALHSVPGFSQVDLALRQFKHDMDIMESESASSGSESPVDALAGRYLSGDDIDLLAEHEAFVAADNRARAEGAALESIHAVGDRLLTERETAIYAGQDSIPADLTRQLIALVDRMRDAGVTTDTAKIAGVVSRDDLRDVASVNEGAIEFEQIRTAANAYLETFGLSTGNTKIDAIARVLADPLSVDRFWPITAAGFHATRWTDESKRKVAETVTDGLVPDFSEDDPALLLAWLAEHPEAELRIPTARQAKGAVERLTKAWTEVQSSARRGTKVKFVRGFDFVAGPHVVTKWQPVDAEAWVCITADGGAEAWEIHAPGETIARRG